MSTHNHLPHLRVTQAVHDSAVLVMVAGEVDIGTVFLLDKGLAAAREQAVPSRTVVVDLHRVRFFGAAGVTALVKADIDCRHQGLVLQIVANHRAVLRPMEVAGLTEALRPVPELSPEWTRRPRATQVSRTLLHAARRILLIDRDRHGQHSRSSLALVD
ncbi:MAG: anti-sigma factor antagonist [Kibdelosporangium sp.]